MKKRWYEALYEDFQNYDDEPYVQFTDQEVDYIEQLLDKDKSLKILDVGCGTGRHTLELSRRGYSVCGLDLSEEMLAQGQKQAQREGLIINFIQGDARALQYDCDFDVVLILCEGGFSLVETDEMDRQILAGAGRALRPNGKLIITMPSASFMLSQHSDNQNFNPVTFRETFVIESKNKNGKKVNFQCSQRYYTFPEIQCLLRDVGFYKIKLFSVTHEGYFNQDKYSTDQFEFGVTAIKNL